MNLKMIPDEVLKMKKLRRLRMDCNWNLSLRLGISPLLRKLEVLSFKSCKLPMLPDSVNNLTHLKQFPVDTLKIDRSFVSKLGMVETQDDVIIDALIELAKNLGIKTVAEGIENGAQFAQLLIQRCDSGQGFLFGKPMAASTVADVISKWDAEAVLALAGAPDWAAAARQYHVDRFG